LTRGRDPIDWIGAVQKRVRIYDPDAGASIYQITFVE
jgi:hypothetical protein